jgi:hypothetical protein
LPSEGSYENFVLLLNPSELGSLLPVLSLSRSDPCSTEHQSRCYDHGQSPSGIWRNVLCTKSQACANWTPTTLKLSKTTKAEMISWD